MSRAKVTQLKSVSSQELTDAIYSWTQSFSDVPDAKTMIICGQLASIFVKALRNRMLVRMRVMIDEAASPMITHLHPTCLRYAVDVMKTSVGKKWTKEIDGVLKTLETVEIVSLSPHAGKHVEVWVANVDAMSLECSCGKVYRTPVNAQRCRYGHMVSDRISEDVLRRTWDGMSIQQRIDACEKLKEYCQDFECATAMIDCIRNPGRYTGRDVLDFLAEETEGTHVIPRRTHPRPDMMNNADLMALVAYVFGIMLLATASLGELVDVPDVDDDVIDAQSKASGLGEASVRALRTKLPETTQCLYFHDF